MFNEMADANYDIHMLESFGNGPEKCVDISLAVEMLHYATVPNAYDVAILLRSVRQFDSITVFRILRIKAHSYCFLCTIAEIKISSLH